MEHMNSKIGVLRKLFEGDPEINWMSIKTGYCGQNYKLIIKGMPKWLDMWVDVGQVKVGRGVYRQTVSIKVKGLNKSVVPAFQDLMESRLVKVPELVGAEVDSYHAKSLYGERGAGWVVRIRVPRKWWGKGW